jgi:hypothetical protein
MNLHEIVVNAEIELFKKQSLITSWNETAGFINGNGFIASGPQIMKLKIDEPVEGKYWKRNITGNTKEVSVLYEGHPYVIVLHGSPIFRKFVTDSPDLTYEKPGAKISPRTVDNILNGRLPEDHQIELFYFKDFIKKDDLPAEYGIILHDHFITTENIALARFGGKDVKESFDKLYHMYIGDNFRTFFSHDHFDEIGRLNFITYRRHSTGPVMDSNDNAQFMGVKIAFERILPSHIPIKVDFQY